MGTREIDSAAQFNSRGAIKKLFNVDSLAIYFHSEQGYARTSILWRRLIVFELKVLVSRC